MPVCIKSRHLGASEASVSVQHVVPQELDAISPYSTVVISFICSSMVRIQSGITVPQHISYINYINYLIYLYIYIYICILYTRFKVYNIHQAAH